MASANKVTFPMAQLMRVLAPLASISSRRSSIPMLNNILIQCVGDRLVLTAADSDMVLRRKSDSVGSDGDFSTTTQAINFRQAAGALGPDSEGVLEYFADRNRIRLSSGRSEFLLPTLPADEFPLIEQKEWTGSFKIKAQVLRWLAQAVSFSMAQDEARRYLNGAFLHSLAGEKSGERLLRLVATDGHRLARAQVTMPQGELPDIEGFIIPRKMILELEKLLLAEDSAEVTVRYTEAMISFEGATFSLIGRLTDGRFPDYGDVIPEAGEFSMLANVGELNRAVGRMLTIAGQSQAVRFLLKNNKLTVSVDVIDGPSGRAELDVKFDSEIEIGFNGRYISQVCDHIGTKDLIIKFKNATEATQIIGVGGASQDSSSSSKSSKSSKAATDDAAGEPAKSPQSGDALFVLMPMRI